MNKTSITVLGLILFMIFGGKPEAQTLPKAIYKTNENAEDLFDYARAGNIQKVKLKVDELNNLYGRYRKEAEENKLTPELLDFYSLYMENINEEFKTKDLDKIAFSANQITGIGSAFDNYFKTKVPPAIARLDYLGRELLLESQTRNRPAINRRLGDIDYTWKSLKSLVLTHNGKKQSEEFENIVAEIKSRKNMSGSNGFNKSVKKYLDQIDRLEQLF